MNIIITPPFQQLFRVTVDGNQVAEPSIFPENYWEIMEETGLIIQLLSYLIKRDMKKKQTVPKYYTVRELTTGRIFQAEYDSESAAYYEKGTGKEHNITKVEQI